MQFRTGVLLVAGLLVAADMTGAATNRKGKGKGRKRKGLPSSFSSSGKVDSASVVSTSFENSGTIVSKASQVDTSGVSASQDLVSLLDRIATTLDRKAFRVSSLAAQGNVDFVTDYDQFYNALIDRLQDEVSAAETLSRKLRQQVNSNTDLQAVTARRNDLKEESSKINRRIDDAFAEYNKALKAKARAQLDVDQAVARGNANTDKATTSLINKLKVQLDATRANLQDQINRRSVLEADVITAQAGAKSAQRTLTEVEEEADAARANEQSAFDAVQDRRQDVYDAQEALLSFEQPGAPDISISNVDIDAAATIKARTDKDRLDLLISLNNGQKRRAEDAVELYNSLRADFDSKIAEYELTKEALIADIRKFESSSVFSDPKLSLVHSDPKKGGVSYSAAVVGNLPSQTEALSHLDNAIFLLKEQSLQAAALAREAAGVASSKDSELNSLQRQLSRVSIISSSSSSVSKSKKTGGAAGGFSAEFTSLVNSVKIANAALDDALILFDRAAGVTTAANTRVKLAEAGLKFALAFAAVKEAQLAALKTDIATTQTSIERINAQISTATRGFATKNDLTSSVEEASARRDAASKRIQRATETLLDNQMRAAQIEVERIVIREEIQALRAFLGSQGGELAQAERYLEQLLDAIRAVRAARRSLSELAAPAQNLVKLARAHFVALEDYTEQLNNADNARAEVVAIRANQQALSVGGGVELQISAYQASVQTFENLIREARSEVSKIDDALDDAQDEALTNELQVSEFEGDVQTLRMNLDTLLQAAESDRREAQAASARLINAQTEVTKSQEEIETVRIAIGEQESQSNTVKADLRVARNQLELFQEQLAVLNSRSETIDSAKDLMAELEEIKARKDSLLARASAIQQTLNGARLQSQTLLFKYQTAQQEVSHARQAADDHLLWAQKFQNQAESALAIVEAAESDAEGSSSSSSSKKKKVSTSSSSASLQAADEFEDLYQDLLSRAREQRTLAAEESATAAKFEKEARSLQQQAAEAQAVVDQTSSQLTPLLIQVDRVSNEYADATIRLNAATQSNGIEAQLANALSRIEEQEETVRQLESKLTTLTNSIDSLTEVSRDAQLRIQAAQREVQQASISVKTSTQLFMTSQANALIVRAQLEAAQAGLDRKRTLSRSSNNAVKRLEQSKSSLELVISSAASRSDEAAAAIARLRSTVPGESGSSDQALFRALSSVASFEQRAADSFATASTAATNFKQSAKQFRQLQLDVFSTCGDLAALVKNLRLAFRGDGADGKKSYSTVSSSSSSVSVGSSSFLVSASTASSVSSASSSSGSGISTGLIAGLAVAVAMIALVAIVGFRMRRTQQLPTVAAQRQQTKQQQPTPQQPNRMRWDESTSA